MDFFKSIGRSAFFQRKMNRLPLKKMNRLWIKCGQLFLDLFDDPVNDAGIMLMLQLLSFKLDHLKSISLFDLVFALVDVLTLIVVFIDIMYRDPAFRLARGEHCMVYMVAVHALSPKFGQ